MTVRVFTPSRTYSTQEVTAVDVESVSGRVALLPRHVDCTVALETGLMMLRMQDGDERYIGVDGGTLVKIGQRVMVSSPRAATEEELGQLQASLEAQRRKREEHAREARQALARLEVELARSLFGAEVNR